MNDKSPMSGPVVKGMMHKLKMIQAIASNIANANSIGYQREIPESMSFKSIMNKTAMRDTTQGQLRKTGNTLDLAIEGNAYFLVESKEGKVEPLRNGRFQLNSKGVLATEDGREVVVIERSDKAANLSNSFDIKINNIGEIFVDGERYGRIAMKIDDKRPVKVHQGYLEGSNVNVMNEMVALAMAFRSFEASEKALSMQTSVDRELIEKYGRNV